MTALDKPQVTDEKSCDQCWTVEVFFDGECPLCAKEVGMLRWLDRKNRIVFTDIAASNFDPSEVGRDMEALMAEIHGRLPSGEVLTGVEVFRRLYAAVGLSPLVACTRLPLISHTLELGYRIFAKNRLKLTGRCNGKTCAL